MSSKTMFEILWKLPKCDTDTPWTNAVGKMATCSLWGYLKPSICKKKMQYRWSAIKQNTIKRGISVICFISLVLLTIFPWDLYFWGFMTFINSWKFRANIPSNIFFSHSFPPSLSGILMHVRLTPYSRNHGILNHSTHLSSSSWFLFLALLNILFATVYSNIYSSILPN